MDRLYKLSNAHANQSSVNAILLSSSGWRPDMTAKLSRKILLQSRTCAYSSVISALIASTCRFRPQQELSVDQVDHGRPRSHLTPKVQNREVVYLQPLLSSALEVTAGLQVAASRPKRSSQPRTGYIRNLTQHFSGARLSKLVVG
jgi:hypothetical protein